MPRGNPTPAAPNYDEFDAVSLYCPQCRAALPVRQRLLLVLPDGELYEYRCARCNTPVGKKKNDVPFGVLPESVPNSRKPR
jgi:hypothetical protein